MTRVLLLVEDNPTDEKLTLRGFKKCGVANEIVVVRDGAEALDYLFERGKYAGRIAEELPAVVLLDLNLPRVGGLEVLRQIRANERTKLLPVMVLTASNLLTFAPVLATASAYRFASASMSLRPASLPG